MELDMNNSRGVTSIMDDDAQVTIQLEKGSVLDIIDTFDDFVKKKIDSVQFFIFESFGSTISLKLELNFYGDNFSISGRKSEGYIFREDDSTYYHDFEIEDITIQEWGEIVNFVEK